MNAEREREVLLEQVTNAWRPVDRDGRARAHPAWHDLDGASRAEAFETTLALRAMEAALDPQGLSTTGRAALARIRSGEPRRGD